MTSTLLHGGIVHVPGHPDVTALEVRGSRIVWVGDESGARARREEVDTTVPLDGALVTAGFVDAHVHLSATGSLLRSADLTGARSREEALGRIARLAARDPGAPLAAPGWDETLWPDRLPLTGTELDRAAGGAAVFAARIDCHSAVISSALLTRCAAHQLDGWLGEGRVERDAHDLARDVFAAWTTPHQRRADVEAALRRAASVGIVQVHECASPVISSAPDLREALAAGARPDLPEVVGYWGELVRDQQQAAALGAQHRVRGLAGDLNVDGSIGSRTAHLRADYADGPGLRGHGYLDAEQVRDHVAACTLAGLQAGFHVIGDAGADTVLDGLERAAESVGLERLRAARHRLEHIEMVGPEVVARLVRLGVTASVQPVFDRWWGGSTALYAERLGAVRAAGLNPLRTMQGAGLPWAAGSDTPVTPFDPWGAIRACVEHHTPASRIGMHEALHAHTVAGYRAARTDDRGWLRVGGEASLVVWEHRGDLSSVLQVRSADSPTARLCLRDGVVIHRAG